MIKSFETLRVIEKNSVVVEDSGLIALWFDLQID